MELAAYADAELINCFPSFSLPPPPVPKHGWSSLACRRGSHGLGAGALRCRAGCPGRHRGWGAPGLHPSTAPLLWASGWANACPPGQSFPSPGHGIPRRRSEPLFPGGQRIPSPVPSNPSREAQHPFPGVRIIPFPGQTATPPAPVTPICRDPLVHPHPRP